jgi:hypothetical protein
MANLSLASVGGIDSPTWRFPLPSGIAPLQSEIRAAPRAHDNFARNPHHPRGLRPRIIFEFNFLQMMKNGYYNHPPHPILSRNSSSRKHHHAIGLF